ncbi:MAG: 50S ribosomal protein L11 methyltransferase, partial [Geminicoccales bacterium]
LSVSAFEAPGQPDRWAIALIHRGEPDRAALLARLAPAASPWHIALDLEIGPIPSTDWLYRTAESFPPQRIGRFWIHGSHVREAPPADAVPIRLDAGQAFGSGEHDSTRGCLLALDRLARRRRLRRVLDLGCGAGLLAIAAAKCWPARVVAADNDPIAVAVAQDNALHNGVASHVRCLASDGYASAELRSAGPYDLILANILADPLRAMARATARNLAPDGTAVLSGLLDRQADRVVAAHRPWGLRLREQIGQGPWMTLVLEHARHSSTSLTRVGRAAPWHP